MKSILKSNAFFIFPFSIFLAIGALLIFFISKTELHLFFNSRHNHFFDVFFSTITYLGDGLMAVLGVIVLLSVKYRYALIVGFSNFAASMLTQALKKMVFNDSLRPKKFFEGMHDIYLVPGVENHLHHSFPSGHATSAFALYFSLALIVKSNKLKLLLFLIALFAAYSRVYLSQHFFEDIYVGSIIGVGVTFLTFAVIQNNQSPKLEKSINSLFK